MMTSWYAIAEKAEIAASVVEASNFVAAAQPGCHVAFHDADWIVGVDDYEPEDLGLGPDEDPPDLSLDPEEALLSVVNTSRTLDKAFFITIYHPAVNGLSNAGAIVATHNTQIPRGNMFYWEVHLHVTLNVVHNCGM